MINDNRTPFMSFLQHLTLEDLNRLHRCILEIVDPLITYDEAAAMLGKSKNALTAKISRSNITPVKLTNKMIRYSDCLKIRDKKV